MLGDTISNTSKLMHLLQHLNIVVIASQKLKVSYFLDSQSLLDSFWKLEKVPQNERTYAKRTLSC